MGANLTSISIVIMLAVIYVEQDTIEDVLYALEDMVFDRYLYERHVDCIPTIILCSTTVQQRQ